MTERRLGITKKVSLAGIGEGWDERCFAVVVAATKRETFAMADVDTDQMTSEQAVDFQNEFVKKHFVKGQVMVLNDDGNLELADMVADDVDVNIELSTRLFLAITGQDADPKDLLTSMVNSASTAETTDSSPSDTATTETRSSTD